MLASCKQLTRKRKIFSIFFRFKKILYRFWEPSCEKVGLSTSLSDLLRFINETSCSASFKYFLENQRHENWRKYENDDGVSLAWFACLFSQFFWIFKERSQYTWNL